LPERIIASMTRNLVPIAALLLATSCSQSQPPAGPAPAAQGQTGMGQAAQGQAGTGQPAQGQADVGQLVDLVRDSTPAEPQVGPGGEVTIADVAFTPPRDWQSQTPTSAMRKAQFRIDGQGGAGEVVVFYFGPGQGGGLEDNVARWFGQFQAPGGGPATDTSRSTREVGGLQVTEVRAHGTYSSGMPGGPTTPLTDHALHGVIVESPHGPVFIKATGPAATIDGAAAAFEALVTSVRRAGP
jgi:hypothetical protein